MSRAASFSSGRHSHHKWPDCRTAETVEGESGLPGKCKRLHREPVLAAIVLPRLLPLEAGRAHFAKSHRRNAFLDLSRALAAGLNPRRGSQTLAEAPSRPVALLAR